MLTYTWNFRRGCAILWKEEKDVKVHALKKPASYFQLISIKYWLTYILLAHIIWKILTHFDLLIQDIFLYWSIWKSIGHTGNYTENNPTLQKFTTKSQLWIFLFLFELDRTLYIDPYATIFFTCHWLLRYIILNSWIIQMEVKRKIITIRKLFKQK